MPPLSTPEVYKEQDDPFESRILAIGNRILKIATSEVNPWVSYPVRIADEERMFKAHVAVNGQTGRGRVYSAILRVFEVVDSDIGGDVFAVSGQGSDGMSSNVRFHSIDPQRFSYMEFGRILRDTEETLSLIEAKQREPAAI